jgi:hypothetical protein
LLQTTQKQGTFTKEISDVLAYYWTIAQHTEEPANEAVVSPKVRARPQLRLVVNKPLRGTS